MSNGPVERSTGPFSFLPCSRWAASPEGEGVVLGQLEDVAAEGRPGWMYDLIPVLLPAGNYRWPSPCSNERVTFAVFPSELVTPRWARASTST